MEQQFTLFWLDGKREVVTGTSISDAFNRYYSSGAMSALDFYADGNDTSYVWNTETRNWQKVA